MPTQSPKTSKSSKSSKSPNGFSDTFARKPARSPRGLVPGRRVWLSLGWGGALTVVVAVGLTLVGSDVFTPDDSSGVVTAETIPTSPAPSLTPSPTPTPTPTRTKSTPTAEAVVQAPPPVVTPEPSSAAPVASAPAAGTRSGGDVTKEVTKPRVRTAAVAVQALATRDPGRHICYRAYVENLGWQAAVCDGATAGTVGQGRPIKALNIAVSGTNGTAATAFVHNPGSTDGKGHYNGPWKGAVDGIDNYIGSGKNSAPDMLGFAINVGESTSVICQTSHVHNEGWHGMGCDEPGGENLIFGGTLNNDLWLEAVKFTV
ncbi:hypothetical protein QQY66_15415 [Streptomyces sp. DG2A-72]|uniref:hypothetical protein n=1 Tax=Streptomyces sp. DG2A-72 TaxID=3051386 RepID=UPI00265C1171|nr:hypothetical protein [Streptomyces sp. DG2A-72]MDO0933011.1 hypothetical protein [Streptomyces sp. DG2A-72]